MRRGGVGDGGDHPAERHVSEIRQVVRERVGDDDVQVLDGLEDAVERVATDGQVVRGMVAQGEDLGTEVTKIVRGERGGGGGDVCGVVFVVEPLGVRVEGFAGGPAEREVTPRAPHLITPVGFLDGDRAARTRFGGSIHRLEGVSGVVVAHVSLGGVFFRRLCRRRRRVGGRNHNGLAAARAGGSFAQGARPTRRVTILVVIVVVVVFVGDGPSRAVGVGAHCAKIEPTRVFVVVVVGMFDVVCGVWRSITTAVFAQKRGDPVFASEVGEQHTAFGLPGLDVVPELTKLLLTNSET